MSALAAVNQAANIDARPRGRCNFLWTYGTCKFGDKCQYEHVDNPDRAVQTEIRNEIEQSAANVRPTEAFPSLSCLDDLSSDALLVPFGYQTVPKVNGLLEAVKRAKSYTRIDQAEETSNRTNDG